MKISGPTSYLLLPPQVKQFVDNLWENINIRNNNDRADEDSKVLRK